jgi:hypothetical protein
METFTEGNILKNLRISHIMKLEKLINDFNHYPCP